MYCGGVSLTVRDVASRGYYFNGFPGLEIMQPQDNRGQTISFKCKNY